MYIAKAKWYLYNTSILQWKIERKNVMRKTLDFYYKNLN